MPRLGDPVVEPGGRYAVYRVVETDTESYARKSAFYLIDLEQNKPEPIRLDMGGDASSAAFGPDGWLYFLSSRRVDGDERMPVVGRADHHRVDVGVGKQRPMVVVAGDAVEGCEVVDMRGLRRTGENSAEKQRYFPPRGRDLT